MVMTHHSFRRAEISNDRARPTPIRAEDRTQNQTQRMGTSCDCCCAQALGVTGGAAASAAKDMVDGDWTATEEDEGKG